MHQNFAMFEHTLGWGCGWQDFLSLGVLFLLHVSNDVPNGVFNVLPMYFQSVATHMCSICWSQISHVSFMFFPMISYSLPKVQLL
jgi:hypothetical protein